MKTQFLAVSVLVPIMLFAAEKFQPLDAKLGLWEITSKHEMTGTPPIPPDVLAKMSPEQRARVEAIFKQKAAQGATPQTRQTCLTQDKLDKAPFNEDRKSCQRTIISSTSSVAEFREECSEADGSKRSVNGRFELSGSSNMKGSLQVKASSNGKAMNINIDMTGKWIGPDCSPIK
jgi:hypothetical protein